MSERMKAVAEKAINKSTSTETSTKGNVPMKAKSAKPAGKGKVNKSTSPKKAPKTKVVTIKYAENYCNHPVNEILTFKRLPMKKDVKYTERVGASGKSITVKSMEHRTQVMLLDGATALEIVALFMQHFAGNKDEKKDSTKDPKFALKRAKKYHRQETNHIIAGRIIKLRLPKVKAEKKPATKLAKKADKKSSK